MSRLFRSNSSISTRSSSASTGLASIPAENVNEINTEEHEIQDLDIPLTRKTIR